MFVGEDTHIADTPSEFFEIIKNLERKDVSAV